MAYPWTFDGTTIDITAVDLAEDTTLLFSERVIPGGSAVYIDIAGAQVPHLTLELYFPDPATYLTMRGKVGTTGSLNYVAGTVTATCTAVRRTRRNLGSTGETWASADFVVTS